jgi:calcium permeable stress-gated cation channel
LAIKILAIMGFFATTVLWPINHFYNMPASGPPKRSSTFAFNHALATPMFKDGSDNGDDDRSNAVENRYLWAYVVFTYFFSIVTVYLMNWETFRVIRIRQDYLGTQSTITDRTFRLSGIPRDLRSEDKIKQLIEKLEIGVVESVTLCRTWTEIDALVAKRGELLKKLEETWIVYVGKTRALPKPAPPRRQATDDGSGSEGHDSEGNEVDAAAEIGENGPLLGNNAIVPDLLERKRPQTRVWYGRLGLQSRKTDAIDHLQAKLRDLDDKIREARKKTYPTADLAFVTMDSIASCQMAIQARIDPRPGQLLTKTAPAPSDVIWANTYSPRGLRRLKSWAVTIFVTILSLIWLIPVASIASLVSICTIEKISPDIAKALDRHAIIKALVQTGLPTLTVSVLNVAVPYVYEFLSYRQGMVSRGDVELSIVSKNFFFAFFNIFLVFSVSGTTSQMWAFLQEALKDTTQVAFALARSIVGLGGFYTNFIMLQGVGLFPLRLLEVGSVVLYPIYRMGSKTPRDFADLTEPPIFSYGFYLPTALLVFILCIIYSVTEFGYQMLFFGLLYFIFGYFTYKYQLLYAMDQPQHATGGAWRIICYRMLLGVLVFQITMTGVMALKSAFIQAGLVVPLLFFTVWYSYYFRRRFEPLTKFIALRSIRIEIDDEDAAALDEDWDNEGPRPSQGLLRRGSTIDEDKEKGLKYINPSLVVP